MKKLIGFPKGLRKQFENVIPDHWDYKDLVKIATVEYGISDPLDRSITSGIPLLSMPNISKEGFLTNAQIPFIEEANVKESELLHKNDILFNWRNGSPEHLGKTFLFLLDGKYTHVGFLLRIRMLDNQTNPIYINEYIRYIKERGFFLRAKIQVNNTFNKEELEGLPVILPTIKEQEKIGIILNDYNDIIINMEKLLVQKLLCKKILMQQLLSGKKRFKKFIKSEWKEKKLSSCLQPVSRQVERPNDKYIALGIRSHGKGTFLREVNNPEEIMMDELYQVKENDLIVNITFAWEGAIAIVNKRDEHTLVSHRFPTFTFNTEQLIPDYFRYLMVQKQFTYNLGLISPGGAGRNRVLNKTDFLKLKIFIPDVDEQKMIASTLLNVDKEIELLRTKLELLKLQKKGLMQKLLTGKIRVKVN